MVKSLRIGKNLVWAEIGVELGDFSSYIMSTFDIAEYHAFDLFKLHELPEIFGRSPAEVFNSKTHQQFYIDRFKAEIAQNRVFTHAGDSSGEVDKVDTMFDVIYVDGDHELEGVKRDALAAIRKLKPDGLLIFNDYIMFDHMAHVPYGVVPVVNELCVAHGWRMTHLALNRNMFCDVVLTRSKLAA